MAVKAGAVENAVDDAVDKLDKGDAESGEGEGEGSGKKPPAAEDPEFDLGAEAGKVKRSDILKWKESGMREEDYRQKTQELTEREAGIEEMEALSELLSRRPEKLGQVMAILKEASEGADTAGKKVAGVDVGDLASKLSDSDPGQAALKVVLSTLKSMQEKMEGFEKREKDMVEKEQADAKEEAVQEAAKLIKTGLDEAQKGFEFVSDDEKDLWRQTVINVLQRTKRKYADEDEFKGFLKETAKKIFERFSRVRETYISNYQKRKGGTPPAHGGEGAPKKKEISQKNIQEVLENEFTELLKEKG